MHETALLKKGLSRSQLVLIYTSSVTAIGVIITLVALANLPDDLLGLLLFCAVAVVAELLSVELFTTSRGSHVSVSSIIAVASILTFGPLAGALTHMTSGIATAITTTTLQNNRPKKAVSWIQRSAFNASMFAIATFLGGWVYVLTGGEVGNVTNPGNILPIIAAASVDWLVNALILLGVITLQTGRNPMHIWRQDFQWAAPIAITGGVVMGGALAVAYDMMGLLGAIVFALPTLAISYSFRLYVNNTKGYVNKLEQLNQDLADSNLGLLETLGAVIDAYDVYTYGHSTQVAVYAAAIAEKLNLSRKEQEVIVKAALVHDIGKVGITDSIVGKPGPLTAEEFEILKRHPDIGATIVSRMKGVQELLPLVRHHHERWDGRGYPDGLAGNEIPLGARVLTLADSLDAMCSDRPYRPTRKFNDVIAEIQNCSGKQFDPEIIKVFLELAKEKGEEFFKNSAVTVDRSVLLNDLGNNSHVVLRFLKKSLVVDK